MSEQNQDQTTTAQARAGDLSRPPTGDATRGPVTPTTVKPPTTEATVVSPRHSAAARTPHPSRPSNSDPSPLYVGLDLGTSRSAICASNGRRATLPTTVGWPKDPIAHGFLGKEIVFGEEALGNRLSIDVCRPFDAGVINLDETEKPALAKTGLGSRMPTPKSRAREAAAELIKHLIALCEPQPNQKIHAAVGTPGQISSTHKQALIEATRSAVHQVHITTEPFAVAFSLNSLHHVLIVDIGAGTVDLCRVHGSVPDESDYLTLREAGNHVDRALTTMLRQKFDKAQFSASQIREYKERFATVSSTAEPIMVTFPVNGSPTTHDITDELRKACQSIVGPISQGITQLIGGYDPEFQEQLKSEIWLAGGGSLINGLLKAIEEAIKPLGPAVRVRRVDDPVFAGADGALKLAQTMPAQYWEVLT